MLNYASSGYLPKARLVYYIIRLAIDRNSGNLEMIIEACGEVLLYKFERQETFHSKIHRPTSQCIVPCTNASTARGW